MKCDNCKYYRWYYNHCEKWDCDVDERAVHNCFEKQDTPIYDATVKTTNIKQTERSIYEKNYN